MVDQTDVLTVHPMMQYQYGVTMLLAYSVYNGVGDIFNIDVTLEDQSKQSYNYNHLWFIYKKCQMRN